MTVLVEISHSSNLINYSACFKTCCIQGVKKVPDPKQNYIGLMTEG